MEVRTASCSCGQLRLTAHGAPFGVSVCHCLACQARTGSTFGVQARYPSESVHVEGQSTEYVRTGDGGTRARFHFCPTCGATVWYRLEDQTTTIVPVGAFRDPAFPPPTTSVYEERMHPWVSVPADVKHIF
jgi:hypothetical protein